MQGKPDPIAVCVYDVSMHHPSVEGYINVHVECVTSTSSPALLHCKPFRLIDVNRALIDITQKRASSDVAPDSSTLLLASLLFVSVTRSIDVTLINL